MIKRILALAVPTLVCGVASAQEARPVAEALARKYADLEASAPHLSSFRGGANIVPYFITLGLILAILYVIIHFTRAGK
jgi:hypothetical protein